MINLKYLVNLLLLLPISSSSLIWLIRDRINLNVTKIINYIITISISIIAIALSWKLLNKELLDQHIRLWSIHYTETIQFEFGGLLDQFNIIFIDLIACISIAIAIYLNNNFKQINYYIAILSKLGIFYTAIFFTLISSNLLQLYSGALFIGIGSYLLHQILGSMDHLIKPNSHNMILNRICDLSILSAIGILFSYTNLNLIDLSKKLSENHAVIDPLIYFISIMLGIKFLQMLIPALIPKPKLHNNIIIILFHVSMITIMGVFCLLRLLPLIQNYSYYLNSLVNYSGLAAILFGILALANTNMIHSINYYSVSQLGILYAIIGSTTYTITMGYLVNFMVNLILMWTIFHFMQKNLVVSDQYDSSIGTTKKISWLMQLFGILTCLNLINFPGTPSFLINNIILNSINHHPLLNSNKPYWIFMIHHIMMIFYVIKTCYNPIIHDHKFLLNFCHQRLQNPKTLIILTSGIAIIGITSTQIVDYNYILQIILQEPILIYYNQTKFLNSIRSNNLPLLDLIPLILCYSLILITLGISILKPQFLKRLRYSIKNHFLFIFKIIEHKYFIPLFGKLLVKIYNAICNQFFNLVELPVLQQSSIKNVTNKMEFYLIKLNKLHISKLNNYILISLTSMVIILLCLISIPSLV